MQFYARASLLVFFAIGIVTHADAVTKRIFHIGNSLTDEVKYDQFMGLAQSRGHTHIWGRQMIPGAPLGWNWDHPGEGFTKAPYGGYYTALTGYDWDALVLQPFQWGYRTEADYANRFTGLALRRYPETMTYIHMTWPANNVGTHGSFETQWLSGPEATNRSRAYFEFVADSVAATFGAQAVRTIPNGEVMYEIDKAIRGGTFSHLTNIWQLYADGIHLNDTGKYLVACTHYAVIYKDDPVGLPTTGFNVPAAMATAIQQMIRQVVLGYPRAGVASFGPYPVTGVTATPSTLELGLGRMAVVTAVISPSNATNKAVNWSSANSAIATVGADGSVTTVSAGTTKLYVITADGAFRDSCALTVVSGGTPVDAVVIAPKEDTVLIGATAQFNAAISPAGATNTTVSWRTLDTTVATVNAGGTVTGKVKGQTRVIVVTNNGAKADTALISVTKPNNLPTAVLDATPIDGYINTYYKFSAARSTDPDPDDFVLGFDWDFGDGSPWNYGSTPYHIYTDTGRYTVRLRVMDYNYARSDWVEQPVSVMPRYAGVLLYEGFEAPLARKLGGMAGGYGWYESVYSSGDANSVIANATPMTYRGLAVRGNYLNAGSGGYRGIDVRSTGDLAGFITSPGLGKADSTLWLSILLRKEKSNDNQVYIRLHPSKFDCCDPNYVSIGYLGAPSNDGGQRYWSVSMNGTVTRGTTALTVGQTSLLVVRLSWTAGSITAAVFADPVELGGPAPSTPSLSATLNAFAPFQAIGLRASGTNEGSLDELRIGTSYAAVTPTEVVATQPRHAAPTAVGAKIRIAATRRGVTVSGLATQASAELLDQAGRVVARRTAQSGTIHFNAKRMGTYIVRVTTKHGCIVQRIVIR